MDDNDFKKIGVVEIERKCISCTYLDRQTYSCHRYPPVLDDRGTFSLPVIDYPEEIWCGEYKPDQSESERIKKELKNILQQEEEEMLDEAMRLPWGKKGNA